MFLYLFWLTTLTLLYFINNKSFKLSRMNVSAVHAVTVIIAYLMEVSGNTLYQISFSYYLLDTIYELITMYQNKKYGIIDLGMIMHHILTMLTVSYLSNQDYGMDIYKAYYMAELSNLPMYLAYHLKHIKYNNKLVITSIVSLEIMAYIILRLYLGGIITLKLLYVPVPLFINLSSISMLIISAVWTSKLIKQVIY